MTNIIDANGDLSARKKITETDRGTIEIDGTTATIVLVGVDKTMAERAAKIIARHTRRNAEIKE